MKLLNRGLSPIIAATMIPFINFLVIPAAVAGATALYHDQFKAIENK